MAEIEEKLLQWRFFPNQGCRAVDHHYDGRPFGREKQMFIPHG
jgi:hypothetical protein